MNRAILSRINLGLWAALVVVTLGGYLLIPWDSSLPVHWGLSGEPDVFWPRNLALLMPPLIGMVTTMVFWAVGRFAQPAQLEASRHAWRTVVPALTGLFLTIQAGTVLVGLAYPDVMVRMICVAIGVMLVLLGNIMPKTQPNGLAGIRLPWLGDAVVWQKTQRLGGLLLMAGGFVLLACTALLGEPMYMLGALLVWLLVSVVGTTIYSNRMAHRR
jgi:uncharacterized membrane protein